MYPWLMHPSQRENTHYHTINYLMEEPLTSNVRPATDAVLTVRIIKSFPYRNVKNHILRSVDLKATTPSQLLDQVVDIVNTTGAMRPYRNVVYDTVKVYTHAHKTKSMNLVINFDEDERDVLVCKGDKKVEKTELLWDLGVENETELSVFNWEAYEEFKRNPEEKW